MKGLDLSGVGVDDPKALEVWNREFPKFYAANKDEMDEIFRELEEEEEQERLAALKGNNQADQGITENQKIEL